MAERNEKSGTTPSGAEGTSGNMPGATGKQRAEERHQPLGNTPGQGNRSYEQGGQGIREQGGSRSDPGSQTGRQQRGSLGDRGTKQDVERERKEGTRQSDDGFNPGGMKGEHAELEERDDRGNPQGGTRGSNDTEATQGGARSGSAQSSRDAEELNEADREADRTEDEENDKPM